MLAAAVVLDGYPDFDFRGVDVIRSGHGPGGPDVIVLQGFFEKGVVLGVEIVGDWRCGLGAVSVDVLGDDRPFEGVDLVLVEFWGLVPKVAVVGFGDLRRGDGPVVVDFTIPPSALDVCGT